MLNVRADSLSSDRQVAVKGCRQCTKRRIKCDRSTPSCRKCTIRGIECPGYQEFQLKWTHGRASGRSNPKTSRETRSQPQITASKHGRDAPLPEARDNDNFADALPLGIQSSMETLVADQCLVDSFTRSALSSTLFTHFSYHVTPRLTWVDRPDHPWRTVISPLAMKSTCLLLSVLSLSAAHLSVTSPNDSSSNNLQTISGRLRDSSVHILNRKIGIEVAGYSSATDNAPRNLIDIMATALVLCYGEMMIPNSTDWSLHLHACRTLIRTFNWSKQPGEHSDAIDFVVKEVADIEVFRNMGAFASDPAVMTITNTLQAEIPFDNYFKAFVCVFREITSEERHRQNLFRNGHFIPSTDMSIWLDKAKHAYARASADTSWLSTVHVNGSREYMEATIRAVYHAICIYSHQALSTNPENGVQMERSISLLAHEVEFLTSGPAHMFSHDIFVPLFILGTVCWGNQSRQDQVEGQFRRLLSSTGIWCNSTALQFLKGFWATSNLQYLNWIQYARENEEQNGPFFVF